MDNRFNKSWYGDKAQLVDSDNDCVIIDLSLIHIQMCIRDRQPMPCDQKSLMQEKP